VTNKSYFQCPVIVEELANGTVVFHITLRNGSIRMIRGPSAPGFMAGDPPAFSMCQVDGSDDVTPGGASPVTIRRFPL
jgi:hypothetical protein